MQGRRVYPNEHGWMTEPLECGDYVKIAPTAMADGSPLPSDWPWQKCFPYWECKSPNGQVCSLDPKIHTITEHEDGTITVAPSILIYTSHDHGKTRIELWHGFLERGVWRTC